MTRVHKLVCDVCKKEKDLLNQVFGYEADYWQTLYGDTDHQRKVEFHVCSTKCAIEFFQKGGSKDKRTPYIESPGDWIEISFNQSNATLREHIEGVRKG